MFAIYFIQSNYFDPKTPQLTPRGFALLRIFFSFPLALTNPPFKPPLQRRLDGDDLGENRTLSDEFDTYPNQIDYMITIANPIIDRTLRVIIKAGMQHPPVTIFPIFLCRPVFVNGIPVAREIFDLALVTPRARFIEKPPRFAMLDLPHQFFFLFLEFGIIDNAILVHFYKTL